MEQTGWLRARDGVRALWRDEAAPTAVEYGIMVGLIAVVIVAAVETLGQAVLVNLFQRTATAMEGMP
jgi:Flp pilus assembly pilin Flp